MKKHNRKGFTIVELVIVIAVVGVLAAILIPTFVSLTKKANKASDQSLVANLNKALAMREGEADDTKNNTMHDAVLDLKLYGFELDVLANKSDEDLVYDLAQNRFLLNPSQVEGHQAKDLWKIVNAIPTEETAKYNYYAGVNFSEEDPVNVKGGFDAGYKNVPTVNYTTSVFNEVVIRTNSFDTTLTIDAASDTVKHYGEAGSLNIIAVANASYHEFGTISQKAQIAEGRLVVESTGKIPLVEVTAVPTAQAPVKIETSKDVVVTVSDAVAASLGENKLPNTEIKVSNTQANVTVDAVVEASSVEINGTSATTEDLKSVYKAYTADDIVSAPTGSYVMLMNDLGPEDMPYEMVQGYINFNGVLYPMGEPYKKENPIELRDKTLDLNGHTIESGRTIAVDVYGTVEILDSSLDKEGKIIHTSTLSSGEIFYVNNYATLIISGGTFTSTQGDGIYVDRRLNSNIIINGGIISAQVYGIVLKPQNGDAYLTINGGTITSQTDYAITGNANHSGTVININGGEISSPNTAIYHPQDGVLNITGGTIYGESAVEMRAGTLTVSGNAVLRGNGSYSCQANGNGHTTTGVALAIAQHTTLKDINVTINGGKFEGAKAVAINNPQENATANVTVTINGGTFSGEIYKNPDNASAWTLTDNR